MSIKQIIYNDYLTLNIYIFIWKVLQHKSKLT